MDGFLDDSTRQQLLDFLTEPGWAGAEPPPSKWERATCDAAPALLAAAAGAAAAEDATAVGAAESAAAGAAGDMGGGLRGGGGDQPSSSAAAYIIERQRRTFGLRDEALRLLAATNPWAKLEVQSRLCKLYPEVCFAHMPSAEIQAQQQQQHQQRGSDLQHSSKRQRVDPHQQGRSSSSSDGGDAQPETAAADGQTSAVADERGAPPAVDCAQWVANAAVAGDSFSWHLDADPASFPDSPWVERVGRWVCECAWVVCVCMREGDGCDNEGADGFAAAWRAAF